MKYGDLISRQAMKNMITNHWSDFSNAANYRTALACVDAVPTVTPAQPYTIHSDGRLWVTVDDIDKVNAVVVDENKSKFCKQFYMDAQPEPHWIPVTERLPDKDGSYLVSGKWGSGKESVGDCEFSVEDGYFRTAWNFDVLAWMLLPEPWKEVTK